jgi:hypothetical protein
MTSGSGRTTDADAFEQRVLRELKSLLLQSRERDAGTAWDRVEVGDVTLDAAAVPPAVQIVFRVAGRPWTYGFAFPTRDADDARFFIEWTPEEWAEVAVANFRERLEAADALPLPVGTDSSSTVWVNA